MSARQITRLKASLGISTTTIPETIPTDQTSTPITPTLTNSNSFPTLTPLPSSSTLTPLYTIDKTKEEKYKEINQQEKINKSLKETHKTIQKETIPKEIKEIKNLKNYYFPIETKNFTIQTKTKKNCSLSTFILSKEVFNVARKNSNLKEQVEIDIQEISLKNNLFNFISFRPKKFLEEFINLKEVQRISKGNLENIFFNAGMFPAAIIRKYNDTLPVLFFYLNNYLEDNKLIEGLNICDIILYCFERELAPVIKDYLNARVVACEAVGGEGEKFGEILFRMLCEVMLRKIRILYARNEYKAALEFGKVLCNLTLYKNIEIFSYEGIFELEKPSRKYKNELFEKVIEKSEKDDESILKELFEFGDDFYLSSLLVEILALKQKDDQSLQQLFLMSVPSAGVASYLSPTLLFSMAYSRKWISKINLKNSNSEKPIILKVIDPITALISWETVNDKYLSGGDCMTLGMVLFPEFSLFLLERVKEKFFGNSDLMEKTVILEGLLWKYLKIKIINSDNTGESVENMEFYGECSTWSEYYISNLIIGW